MTQKVKNWGGFGVRGQGSLKVTENSTIRLSAYEFLLDFSSNNVPILHHF